MDRKHTKANAKDDEPTGELGDDPRGKAKLELLKQREEAGVAAPEPPGEVW